VCRSIVRLIDVTYCIYSFPSLAFPPRGSDKVRRLVAHDKYTHANTGDSFQFSL